MKFQNGNKIGHRFTADNQPAGRGRPRSIISESRAHGLGKDDIVTIISNALAGNREVATQEAQSTKANIVSAIISKKLAEGDFRALMEMLKFAFGTTMEVKGAMSVKNSLEGMTEEELQKELMRLQKINDGQTD